MNKNIPLNDPENYPRETAKEVLDLLSATHEQLSKLYVKDVDRFAMLVCTIEKLRWQKRPLLKDIPPLVLD